MTAPSSTLVHDILALAGRHGVALKADPLDRWGQAITRLAADGCEQDEVEIALVHLARAGHVSLEQSQVWLLQYLQERED